MVEHETDDRLDQLMMEDDLTDARIEAMATLAEEQERREGITATRDPPQEQQDPPIVAPPTGCGLLSPGECQELLLQCHDLLSVVCDVLHSRCTKILSIRGKVYI